jgi:RHS repeat-associated protein
VRGVATTGPGGGTATYTYDATGNTLTRPGPAGTQTLTWDAEGHLGTSTEGGAETGYVYDADGNRIITRDPRGRTLYLPEGQQVRADTGRAAVGTRYYSHAGQTFGVRTGGAMTWLVEDHQGTAHASVVATGQAVTRRYQKPFGEARGLTVAWPGDRGFVGGTDDDTGTVHLGAREFDQRIGAFLSVDPLVDYDDPQQMHGYSYANGSPVTMSDPDGLKPYEGDINPCRGMCATYSAYYTARARPTPKLDLDLWLPPVFRRPDRNCRGSCQTYRDHYTWQNSPFTIKPRPPRKPAFTAPAGARRPMPGWDDMSESRIKRERDGLKTLGDSRTLIEAAHTTIVGAADGYENAVNQAKTPEARMRALQTLSGLRENPHYRALVEFLDANPWVRRSGRALIVLGWLVSFVDRVESGEPLGNAILYASLETAGSAIGGTLGGTAGAFVCGPPCAAAGAAAGGYLGGEGTKWLIDHGVSQETNPGNLQWTGP